MSVGAVGGVGGLWCNEPDEGEQHAGRGFHVGTSSS